MFRPPALEDLAVHANRLLKFRFPVQRNRLALEQLVSRQLHHPRFSKTVIGTLPVALMEMMGTTLWETTLGSRADMRDVFLTLYLLAEELIQFRADEWVRQDVELLTTTDSSEIHGAHYENGSPPPESLRAILAAHGFRTDLLRGDSPLREYLACRHLTQVPPWTALLEAIAEPDASRLPLLVRLRKAHEYLSATGKYRSIQPDEDITALLDELTALVDEIAPRLPDTGRIRPVRKLMIVEGVTEQLLIPCFAGIMNYDFPALGILVLPAGGKNQVIQLYGDYARVLNIPVTVVLDSDARRAGEIIRDELRPQDRLYVIEEGEFEDAYDPALVLKTINDHYEPVSPITEADFNRVRMTFRAEEAPSRVTVLKALWNLYELKGGGFDKIHFAERIAESLHSPQQVPAPIRAMIEEVARHGKNGRNPQD